MKAGWETCRMGKFFGTEKSKVSKIIRCSVLSLKHSYFKTHTKPFNVTYRVLFPLYRIVFTTQKPIR